LLHGVGYVSSQFVFTHFFELLTWQISTESESNLSTLNPIIVVILNIFSSAYH